MSAMSKEQLRERAEVCRTGIDNIDGRLNAVLNAEVTRSMCQAWRQQAYALLARADACEAGLNADAKDYKLLMSERNRYAIELRAIEFLLRSGGTVTAKYLRNLVTIFERELNNGNEAE